MKSRSQKVEPVGGEKGSSFVTRPITSAGTAILECGLLNARRVRSMSFNVREVAPPRMGKFAGPAGTLVDD